MSSSNISLKSSDTVMVTEEELAGEAWAEYHGFDSWQAMAEKFGYDKDTFELVYEGIYDSREDFAKEYLENRGEVHDDMVISKYVDWGEVWDGEFHYAFEAVEARPGVYIFKDVREI